MEKYGVPFICHEFDLHVIVVIESMRYEMTYIVKGGLCVLWSGFL